MRMREKVFLKIKISLLSLLPCPASDKQLKMDGWTKICVGWWIRYKPNTDACSPLHPTMFLHLPSSPWSPFHVYFLHGVLLQLLAVDSVQVIEHWNLLIILNISFYPAVKAKKKNLHQMIRITGEHTNSSKTYDFIPPLEIYPNKVKCCLCSLKGGVNVTSIAITLWHPPMVPPPR